MLKNVPRLENILLSLLSIYSKEITADQLQQTFRGTRSNIFLPYSRSNSILKKFHERETRSVMIQRNNKRTGAQVSLRGFAFASAPGMRAPSTSERIALALHLHARVKRVTRADLTLLLCTFYGAIMERASASGAFIAENWSAPSRLPPTRQAGRPPGKSQLNARRRMRREGH